MEGYHLCWQGEELFLPMGFEKRLWKGKASKLSLSFQVETKGRIGLGRGNSGMKAWRQRERGDCRNGNQEGSFRAINMLGFHSPKMGQFLCRQVAGLAAVWRMDGGLMETGDKETLEEAGTMVHPNGRNLNWGSDHREG